MQCGYEIERQATYGVISVDVVTCLFGEYCRVSLRSQRCANAREYGVGDYLVNIGLASVCACCNVTQYAQSA